MIESERRRTDANARLTSEPDATGYRRPLPARDHEPGFSTNGARISANDGAGEGSAATLGLDKGMDRPPPPRLLSDWPLAVKSILLFWLFYFVVTATRVAITETPGQAEMMRRRVMVVAVACLLSGLVYLALRAVRRASMPRKLIVAALAILPAAIVLAGVNYYVFYVYSQVDAAWAGQRASDMQTWSLTKVIAYDTHGWFFFVAAWAAIYVAMSTARDLRQADQRAALFAREAQEAQLRALRYQINPHFLFNTLNSLSSLVLARRNEAAERMLMNLSAFFRSTLAADPTADVSLAEEIRLQQLYLEIEQARFPDRLIVEVDVPDALAKRRVPVLILQPIVENSVKYGVARARRPVTVRIEAFEEAGRLHIKVSDDGEGAATAQAGESTGVGLRNVCERLASRFGDAAGCIHGPDPGGGYTVHIYLPESQDD